MPETMDAMDRLLAQPPYAAGPEEKSALLVPAVQAALRHHYAHCAPFRALCDKRGFDPDRAITSLADLPYLPVQFFKELVLSSVESDAMVTLRSSATTSGVPSRIVVDPVTAKRQKRAVAAVLGDVLGSERLPFVVFDADPAALGEGPTQLTARGAAIRGFLLAAREARFVMGRDADGGLRVQPDRLRDALDQWGRGPLCLFGFTAILHEALVQLRRQGIRHTLPEATLLHIGGWKRLQARAVTKPTFASLAAEVLGVRPGRVIDVYGFTEQIGMLYPDCEQGVKHAPVFAEVIVRDPRTLQSADDGRDGLLQFIFPIPHSYPGISVITDDVGRIVGRDRCGCGRSGTAFLVLGRAPAAEPRGCGDLMRAAVGSA